MKHMTEYETNYGSKGFRAGYLFKPNHSEIHFIRKGATGDTRRKYGHNYTRNVTDALVGYELEKVQAVIIRMVSTFPADSDYQWTPVVVDIASNTYIRYLDGDWEREPNRVIRDDQ